MTFSISNYETINIFLDNGTKTLSIEIDHRKSKYITELFLSELEAVIVWSASHVEISSIFIYPNSDRLGEGLSPSDLENFTPTSLNVLLNKIQKIIYSFFFMPQTIIIDVKKGAQNISAELLLGADIKIGNEKTILHFNHLERGLVPCCGGIGILSSLVSHSFARSWILQGKLVDKNELMASGLIKDFYINETRGEVIDNLLKAVSKQASVSRIQSKLSLFETIASDLEKSLHFETSNALTGHACSDWKEILNAENEGRRPNFISPKLLVNSMKKNHLFQ